LFIKNLENPNTVDFVSWVINSTCNYDVIIKCFYFIHHVYDKEKSQMINMIMKFHGIITPNTLLQPLPRKAKVRRLIYLHESPKKSEGACFLEHI